MNNGRAVFCFLIGSLILVWGWLVPGDGLASAWKNLCADGRTNTMPVQWDQVSRKIIAHLDRERLDRGEVISEIKKINSQTAAAQSVGLIKADPEACFSVVRSYNLGSHQFEPYPGNPNYTLHTYTLTLEGKNWLQQSAFRLAGRKTMEEVTQGIRKALKVKE